jgi:hypothetical protein
VLICSLVSVATFFAGTGCASKPMNSVEIPKGELPSDFKDKFDVRDTSSQVGPSSVTPSPSPSPSPEPEKSKKVSRRKHHKHSAEAVEQVSAEPSPSPSPFVIPNRRPAKDPIWVGEKLVYEITYFGMAAGDFTVEALPFKTVNGRKVYHIQGKAESSKVFSMFYRLSDMVESFIDYEGMFSYRFHLVLDESKQSRDALELYDHDKGQTFYWNRWNHYQRGYLDTKEYGKIDPLTQDSISALMYVRTLPLKDGEVISIPVASEGKSWECVVTVIRREMLDTPMGKIQTVVVKPETKFHGVIERKGDSYMWLTDDDRHFLVRVEAKVKIGTVIGRLKKVESLGTPPAQQ